ncbi:MAG: hypothetical protein MHM6MM_002143 [Cercozoa sp. M6MM]
MRRDARRDTRAAKRRRITKAASALVPVSQVKQSKAPPRGRARKRDNGGATLFDFFPKEVVSVTNKNKSENNNSNSKDKSKHRDKDKATDKSDGRSISVAEQWRQLLNGNRPEKCQEKRQEKTHEKPQEKRPFFATLKSRRIPGHKRIPRTRYAVDAFGYKPDTKSHRYAVTRFFLTHFHSDHYGGLEAHFAIEQTSPNAGNEGTLLCSPITARLVLHHFPHVESRLRVLRMNMRHVIRGTNDSVTLLEANHCPGACLLLFQLADGRVILHTGDFRWSSELMLPKLKSFVGRIDTLYLDTTYCAPKHRFPSQSEMIERVRQECGRLLQQHGRTRVCFYFGTYLIGKERVFMSVAQTEKLKLWAKPSKVAVLRMLELFPSEQEFDEAFRADKKEATVRVVGMSDLSTKSLSAEFDRLQRRFRVLCAFRPTGWTQRMRCRSALNGRLLIYDVPYSEHSSFGELRDCVKSLQPKTIIPTVNVRSKEDVTRQVSLLTSQSSLDGHISAVRADSTGGNSEAPKDTRQQHLNHAVINGDSARAFDDFDSPVIVLS